ncbi:MAG: prepilin-type N-terminal cleavage/methylation domain-containing protein [Candidatus Omnitrophica bacterium]|nr:prepilin-type N-terminal cleavage/methylation domain-containing protein [Candidatus Omnitrophota bacterium]
MMDFPIKTRTGFTLIELVIVIAFLVSLGVLAYPQFTDIPVAKAQYAIHKIQSDVRYAQLAAMETTGRTRINFNTTTDAYELERESTPGNWVALVHPATRLDYDVTFAGTGSEYSGVDITAAIFGSGSTVIFNTYGAPYDGAGNSLAEPAYVELNSKYRLQFRADTGKVDIVTL